MTYNAGIILAGERPDIFGAFERGSTLGRQNALADLYRTQGPEIAAGNRNALNALARFDPRAAFDLQDGLDARARAEATARRDAEDYAAGLSAEAAKAEAAKIERGVAAGLAARTPEEWDALARQFGADALVGRFESREAIAQSYMGVADVLKLRGATPGPQTEAAKLNADLNAGLLTQEQYQAELARRAPRQTSLSFDPATGQMSFNDGAGVPGAAKELTANKSRLTLFQNLQTETAPILDGLETKFDPANFSDAAAATVPIVGNYFKSEEYQLYQTAASAWAEGALRISTGAAATQPEIERVVATYFAVPGDTPQTVALKSKMRAMYARSVGLAMGDAPTGETLSLPDLSADEANFMSGE